LASPVLRAFTLLEVLVAIALVVALVGALLGFFHDILTTRAIALEHALQQRAAATLVERLETDVVATLVGDVRSGAGVRGEATRLRLLTRGVMPQLASRGLDDPAPLGDLQIVEYLFNQAAHRLEARKSSASAGEAESSFAPLGGEIAHVRFRYLDHRQWRETFDSLAAGHLPQAVEVAIWFNSWPADSSASGDEDSSDESSTDFAAKRASRRLPQPDRLRVIMLPDGGADDAFMEAEQ
jgi:type II secretory pathway component PulJ